jgi:nitroreductase
MNDPKKARPDHPIDDLIANRWSPYVFDERPVPDKDLLSLFEAARWAPSSYNEQPWRYIVATKDDPEEFDRLLSCLTEGNQMWARHAPVLALGVVSLRFERNDKPNRAAHHDLGQASANLSHEATKRGLSVHQMIGVMPDRAREIYHIPEGFEVLTGLAIGYRGKADAGDRLGKRDHTARTRRPVSAFLFSGDWGRPLSR